MASQPKGKTEIELKLSAAPDIIKALAHSATIKHGSQGDGIVKQLESTYFDTPDLRLRSRGISLRVRKDGGHYIQTMKTAGGAGGAIARRGEWETPVVGPLPDLAAINEPDARELLGLILPGELRPVFTNRVRREVRRVNGSGKDGRPRMIEVAVDLGETQSGEATEPIAEIELELLSGGPENVFDMALELHRIDSVHIERRSKAERGYALSTNTFPVWHKARPISFNPGASLDESLAAVFDGCFRHWTANEAAAADGRDPEGIHQMRVGLRRLRSALSIFGPLLPGDSLAWLKTEARHVIGALGQARDLDVFLAELLTPVIDEFPHEPALATLKRAAERAKAGGYDQARAAIAAPRYTEFVLRFGGWVEGRRWRTDGNTDVLTQPLIGYADKLLGVRHGKALKLGRKFETLSVDDRHRVRIALKQLRYTSEFFESLHSGRKTKRYVKSLARMQDSLGHLNDVAVAERLIEEISKGAIIPSERAEIQRATGLLVGWFTRGVADAEPETVSNWKTFAAAMPFWRS